MIQTQRKALTPVGICHVPTTAEMMVNHGMTFAETVLAANKCHCLHEGIFLFERHRPIAWHVSIGNTHLPVQLKAWMDVCTHLGREIDAFGMLTVINSEFEEEGEVLAMRAETASGSVSAGFRNIRIVDKIPFANKCFILEDPSGSNDVFGSKTFKDRKVNRGQTNAYVRMARQHMLASRPAVLQILADNRHNELCTH